MLMGSSRYEKFPVLISYSSGPGLVGLVEDMEMIKSERHLLRGREDVSASQVEVSPTCKP